MLEQYATQIHILHFLLIVAGFCATAFPLVYARSTWYRSTLGRVLMLHGIALALAVDLTILFTYWRTTDIGLVVYVNMAVIALLAFATLALLYLLVRTQYSKQVANPQLQPHHDGTMEIQDKDGKKVFSLELEVDPQELEDKEVVIFKVSRVSPEGVSQN